MLKILTKKIPFFYLPVSIIATVIIFIFSKVVYGQKSGDDNSATYISDVATATCDFSTPRLQGYSYIKPLLFVEPHCESSKLSSLKSSLSNYLNEMKQTGVITAASVFFKDLNTHEWTGYNPDEKHSPGSLLKVPELITFLRMEEANPGTLQKRIMYSTPLTSDKKQRVFISKSIELGKAYTIRQLLEYMISYSDNNATILLNQNIDVNIFKKTFTDLGLKAPDWNSGDYPLSAREFSLFMRCLYNASYLSINNSEFAAELLGTCDFKDGFNKAMPANVKMAHKFGEAKNAEGEELSESGLFFVDDKAYVLTVMTRGNDIEKLSQIIQGAGSIVYKSIAK